MSDISDYPEDIQQEIEELREQITMWLIANVIGRTPLTELQVFDDYVIDCYEFMQLDWPENDLDGILAPLEDMGVYFYMRSDWMYETTPFRYDEDAMRPFHMSRL